MKFSGVDYYDIEGMLSDDEKILRDTVRDFMDREFKPLVIDSFHHEKPLDWHDLAPKLGELGLIGPILPREYGCAGASYMSYGLIAQEAERVDSAIGGYIREETALFMYPVWKFGSEDHKKILPQLARGEKIGCFGLTEPDHGSDVASMSTVAKRRGNKWVINGSKQWISEATDADYAIIWAQTDDGIRAFLVERGTEGFVQSFESHKGSMRASDVGSLSLMDCVVSEENMLPKALGLRSPLMCLDQARFVIAWGSVGAAMDCYETALNYTKEREQFGAPIASYQLVQEKLVDMLIEITKAQLVAYRLARLMDEGKATYNQISLAKKNNTAMARKCARTARDLLGANGISLKYSPIRHMANFESIYTYQGTDHTHTLILGRDITGISAFRSESQAQ